MTKILEIAVRSGLARACRDGTCNGVIGNPSSHDSAVIWDHILNITASLSLGTILALSLGSNALAFEKSTFFDAALCKPPYSSASATRMYDEAEKLAKADTSLMTAAVYKLPADFGRQGFEADEVVFAGTSFGVLVEGLRADDLAKSYHLSSDGLGNLFGTATKSYGRALAKAEQPAADMGIVSVIARESAAFPGKTLLACEFVSHEDLEAMKSLQSQSK
ncbi:hypothetical protein GR212_31430 [Rhizobium lusitanum]|uniref:Uncharacterized protein n=1 Tax=Rhizobium lusitanum TaxID=293958 RepID=A0A6L9UEJ7_9HYPH|nr:hypothetical protein [Rhizobium lusitanum]NEI74074.1 hypothetical protein [Rhizobium lusitanum]